MEEKKTSRELLLVRIIGAPPEKVFRAWTEPELLMQWFTLRPWILSSAELDVRPGGSSVIIMRSPEGKELPNRGVYLDVVKNERIVFTDAYMKAWEPSEKAFMTATLPLRTKRGKRNTRLVYFTGARLIAKPIKKWAPA